jgi:hypothetical protein
VGLRLDWDCLDIGNLDQRRTRLRRKLRAIHPWGSYGGNMRLVNINEAFELIKKKLNLKIDVIENDWCGDTQSGFYTEYEIDIDALNEEIDRFTTELVKKEPK